MTEPTEAEMESMTLLAEQIISAIAVEPVGVQGAVLTLVMSHLIVDNFDPEAHERVIETAMESLRAGVAEVTRERAMESLRAVERR